MARQFAAARADRPGSGGLLTRLASSLHSRHYSDPIGIALGRAIRLLLVVVRTSQRNNPWGGARRSSYLDRCIEQERSNKGGRLSGCDTARQGQRRPIAGLRGKYPAWCQTHVIDQIRELGSSTLSPRRTGPDRAKDICGRCLYKSRPASDEVRMFVVRG